MFQDKMQAGRELLQLASNANGGGVDVLAYIDGIPPLAVRQVDAIADNATFATVRCWSNDEGKSVTWLIPLANVLAVEVRDECHG